MLLPVSGQQYKMHAVDITGRVQLCRGTLGSFVPLSGFVQLSFFVGLYLKGTLLAYEL